ncbi:transcription factor jumonji, jmjC domain-containing protein [Angomonas deanei]|uniref:Cupin-like domain containing protein, putative n=1 Tax=Angomonas deanei TaxID=59799 RepID=A0A7G2C6E4_9TRYP|nr:transcription factor jumonji, jmjC domain-containing protein [Angomonas deanei]CAD2215055.1 Cupin-like domain containing protein, putative [Angomonas deanei]|eukprot:EPY39289.1 transcription factor jumonji, jmjC domain-containing protein [Angomonas deanei]
MEEVKRPKTLLEAFSNTAKALQQFGLERIYVEGLSSADRSDEYRVLSQIEFMRQFVFLNRPCVILGAADDWPAMQKWRDDDYLFDLKGELPLELPKQPEPVDDEEEEEEEDEEELYDTTTAGPKRVTVAITPNGRADAMTYVLYDATDLPAGVEIKEEHVVPVLESNTAWANAGESAEPTLRKEKIFMYATEIKATLPELYYLLKKSPTTINFSEAMYVDMRQYAPSATPTVAYAQLQNNCWETEYTHLHGDITTNVKEFGNVVFGEEKPEASNVWFGIPASVSSFHQDWVENLYTVIRGVKEFVLIPPWEAVLLPKPVVPAAKFSVDKAASPFYNKERTLPTDNHDEAQFEHLQFTFHKAPKFDDTTVPWIDFDITPEVAEGDASGIAAEFAKRYKDNQSRKEKHLQQLEEGDGDTKPVTLHPLVARVAPGETLYLPAMWGHRVGQRADERDIRERANSAKQAGKRPPLPLIAAVNYWYDMSFDNPAVVLLNEFGLLL